MAFRTSPVVAEDEWQIRLGLDIIRLHKLGVFGGREQLMLRDENMFKGVVHNRVGLEEADAKGLAR
jgi:hypothetical protein